MASIWPRNERPNGNSWLEIRSPCGRRSPADELSAARCAARRGKDDDAVGDAVLEEHRRAMGPALRRTRELPLPIGCGSGRAEISFLALPPARLGGLLELPRAKVIAFHGVDGQERRRFLRAIRYRFPARRGLTPERREAATSLGRIIFMNALYCLWAVAAPHMGRAIHPQTESTMTPEERNLITGLFDRIRETGAGEKDRQAENLIRDAIRQIPDAPTCWFRRRWSWRTRSPRLTSAFASSRNRWRASREQLAPPSRSSSSFLGGGRPQSGRSARPHRSRATASQQEEPAYQQQPRSPWGSAAGSPPPPMAGSPPPPMTGPAAAAASSGGGFFRSAMTAAAGVAGGVLMAEHKGMFGGAGHGSTGSETHQTGSGTPAPRA